VQIGIEGNGDKTYVVIDFDDGQRAVKGPMDEVDAKELVDGMLTEMKTEGFQSRAVGGGNQLPLDNVWVPVGVLVTWAAIGLLMWWLL
jgi:hypothetical protein